jgi:Cu+-exporting ATPase
MSSATQNTTGPTAAGENHIELAIGGMTCASCAARIEKKLNRLDGVTVTVNYATEKAKVTFTGDVTPADLIPTVEKTGYTAQLPEPRRPRPTAGSRRRRRPTTTSAPCGSD